MIKMAAIDDVAFAWPSILVKRKTAAIRHDTCRRVLLDMCLCDRDVHVLVFGLGYVGQRLTRELLKRK